MLGDMSICDTKEDLGGGAGCCVVLLLDDGADNKGNHVAGGDKREGTEDAVASISVNTIKRKARLL